MTKSKVYVNDTQAPHICTCMCVHVATKACWPTGYVRNWNFYELYGKV